VWTGVHLEDAPPQPADALSEVVCALDLGPQSSRTLEWAAGLQKEFGARLTLVHAPLCPADAEGRGETEVRIRKELDRLLEEVGSQATVLIEPGDPPKVVCGVAARLHADLLVIARGSARGVFGRLRTNAYAIIRQSPCPVVSV
jgi:nucleotide-binding universal stress UspA family protein